MLLDVHVSFAHNVQHMQLQSDYDPRRDDVNAVKKLFSDIKPTLNGGLLWVSILCN